MCGIACKHLLGSIQHNLHRKKKRSHSVSLTQPDSHIQHIPTPTSYTNNSRHSIPLPVLPYPPHVCTVRGDAKLILVSHLGGGRGMEDRGGGGWAVEGMEWRAGEQGQGGQGGEWGVESRGE